jgi:hypothetical protein
LLLGPGDLDHRLVVALKQLEKLAGDGSLQAPANIPGALALQPSPSGVAAAAGVVAEPSQHDGVQRPVELPIAATVQSMPGDLPRRRGNRVDPGQGGKGGP